MVCSLEFPTSKTAACSGLPSWKAVKPKEVWHVWGRCKEISVGNLQGGVWPKDAEAPKRCFLNVASFTFSFLGNVWNQNWICWTKNESSEVSPIFKPSVLSPELQDWVVCQDFWGSHVAAHCAAASPVASFKESQGSKDWDPAWADSVLMLRMVAVCHLWAYYRVSNHRIIAT